MNHMIYDYETLGQNRATCPVVNLAKLTFDPGRFVDKPYTWQELVDSAKFIKFDVRAQIARGRKPEKSTMDWWENQSAEARKQLLPSDEDRPLEEAIPFLMGEVETVWTRGNSFDPVITDFICIEYGLSEPYPFWTIRDTRTAIDSFSLGTNYKSNKFMPRAVKSGEFIAHDPIHDIAIDVLRLQELIQLVLDTDEIPF